MPGASTEVDMAMGDPIDCGVEEPGENWVVGVGGCREDLPEGGVCIEGVEAGTEGVGGETVTAGAGAEGAEGAEVFFFFGCLVRTRLPVSRFPMAVKVSPTSWWVPRIVTSRALDDPNGEIEIFA